MGIKDRINWFIKLRWYAILGVLLILFVSEFIFEITLEYRNLFFGIILLLIGNISFYLYNKRIEKNENKLYRFAIFQILYDLFLLIYFIHFSGNLENPFVFFLIFHMVISSILLSNRIAFFFSGIMSLTVGILGLLEYLKILPHHHLSLYKNFCLFNSFSPWVSVYIVLTLTLFITTYMAISIINELREKEKNLIQLNELLYEQDRLKSIYVFTISHDIQGSLSAIQNCLRVILDGFTEEVKGKVREMIERAYNKTNSLISFVKDLLFLSKIKSLKEIKKDKFSLKEVVLNIIDELKTKISEKKISIDLKIPDDMPIFANYDAIRELFFNLIVNAIDYNTWGGKIFLEIKKRPEFEECYHIKIEDTGIGIPNEDIDKIFNDFYRAQNAIDIKRDGTGLGLSIVKEILKIHNGDIWVESQLSKGTSFFLLSQVNIIV